MEEVKKHTKKPEWFISGNCVMDNSPRFNSSVMFKFDEHEEGSIEKAVKAVNHHDELVEALDMARSEIESLYKRLGYNGSSVLTKAEQLLNDLK